MSERKRGILKYAIFADPFKKSNVKIVLEFVSLWVHKRDFPRHYLTNMLYRKNVGNIRNYISAKENNLIHLWSKKLGGNDRIFSKDKVKFEHLLKEHHIRTPKIYFYNRGNILYYDDNEFPVKDYQDVVGVIEDIFKKENISSLFCKPVQGGRG